jgi:hypothetical protein
MPASDACTNCPVDCSAGPPAARGDRPSAARTGEARPLDVLDRSFRLLVCEPAPLSLDGRAVGYGLPAGPIPLDVLRSLLLHSSVGLRPATPP